MARFTVSLQQRCFTTDVEFELETLSKKRDGKQIKGEIGLPNSTMQRPQPLPDPA
jgi:hypothetical protein